MSKKVNGRTFAVTLVAGDAINGVKLIGRSLCRIISKDSPTSGVVARDGVVEVAKTNGQAWTQFQQLYWDAANSRITTTAGSNTPAGLAAAPAEATATVGDVLLNGLPAIWGD